MKTPGRPGKKKEGRKKPEGWPCFKSYYVGLCSGHSFPYTPTTEETRQYCMTADFHLRLIYEQYLSAEGRDGK